MASKKQHAAIDFQGAAKITIGGDAGDSGEVLTSGGSGAMTWGSGGSGGGDKVRISTTTLDNDRYINLTPFSSAYNTYEIYFENCDGQGQTSNCSEALILRAYVGSTPTALTSGYSYYSDASPNEGGDEEDCMIYAPDGPLSFFCCAFDQWGFSGKVTLMNPTETLGSYKFIESRFQSRVYRSDNFYAYDAGTKYWNTHGSVYTQGGGGSTALTKLRFTTVRGELLDPTWGVPANGIDGSVSVYGLKNS